MIDLSRVDLNLLVIFDALMTERKVTAAAARVRLTQPAVSHALRRLRLLFGDELFIRGAGGMQPTARALDLHVPIRAAIGHVLSALGGQEAFDPATARRGFRLAMTEVMTVELLPRLIPLLRREAPGVDLIVVGSGAGEAADVVAAGGAELGMGVLPDLPEGLLTEELYADTLACVVDRQHPLLRDGRLTLEDYLAASHVTVASQRHLGIELDDILAKLGMRRRVVAVLPHYVAVPAVVVGTDLVGHIRQRLVSIHASHERLLLFPPPIPVPLPPLRFLQVWHRRDDRDAGHRWLRGLVRQAVSLGQGTDPPERG
ncbi:LysR family transcriptional regulator [Roseomonas populi]|uniref:LysR family transcriptional regulator n=1 Tax=Roseomonas populi TaxID=3121582 RepID=A0ABT1XAS5_9PROT|nr:LysR family transcriptional regulator [Roseomonas pecuniae]MCR0984528.1 LysR family transcriptional regulator [Roseomonas pecuniae]